MLLMSLENSTLMHNMKSGKIHFKTINDINY